MRAVFAAFAILVAVPTWAPAASADGSAEAMPSNGAFRVKLVQNADVAMRTSAKLAALSRQPAPSKLSAPDRRLYNEQSKWLSNSAAKLSSLHARMQVVLAKGERAPITEVATTNMELVTIRDAFSAESRRYNVLHRTAAALSAVKATK